MLLRSRLTARLTTLSIRPLRTFSSVARNLQTPQPPHHPDQEPQKNADSKVEAVSSALSRGAEQNENRLVAPVHIPEDPHGVLKENHPAISILENSTIVVQRQLEMMNVLMGFEQANRYVVMDPLGNHIGYLAEQEHGMGNMMARQMLRTHRSFTTHVFDRHGREVLRFHRPFSWISSRIRVYDSVHASDDAYTSSSALENTSSQGSAQMSTLPLSSMRVIGEAQQQWAPLRRKYNLFLHRKDSQLDADPDAPQLTSGEIPLSKSTAVQVRDPSQDDEPGSFVQFAYVSEPFLSWDFSLLSSDNRLLGSVNRNFVGFARELFTDTGVYALRMDSAALEQEAEHRHVVSQTGRRHEPDAQNVGMTLDQRAVMLATAVSIDFDYFSRKSSGAGGFMPLWFPWGGGAAEAGAGAGAAEAGAGAAAGEAGAVAESGASAVGQAARGAGGAGIGEGAVTGAGTMAGYEAMQRGMHGNQEQQPQQQAQDDASPTNQFPPEPQMPGSQQGGQNQEDVWGAGSEDPWKDQGPPPGGDGGGSGGDGGGWSIWDFFDV